MPHSRGHVVLISLIFFGAIIIGFTGLINYLTTYARSERHALAAEQALALAEAGIDQAVYALNQNDSYAGESASALGAGTFTVSVATEGSTKRITSTGSVSGTTRVVKASVSVGTTEISFRYGVQAGTGGFTLAGGSTINGNVYSNGDINATNGVHITGSAIAANPVATSTAESNATPVPISSCTSSTCVTFGNASASQDFAQSFTVSSAQPLNSIDLYIKKTSTPGDITIRIVNDNGGSPGTDVLMTSTLAASKVTSVFGWATTTLPATPVLEPGQTYWIVLDTGTNASRYYTLGANAAYMSGTGKLGQHGGSWSNTSPAGLDGYFHLYVGGGNSIIGGSTYIGGVYTGSVASDETWAYEVKGASVTGSLYCQVGSSNNKACNTSRGVPTAQPMPLSDANVEEWKEDAAAGGTLTGNQTVGFAGATLGPTKIVGNLLVNSGGTLTLSGTIWVTGTITVTGGGKVRLASSYGTNDGMIVSDGIVSLSGGATFSGSGQTGSYPFLITTSACPTAPGCNGANAITMNGGAGTVALIAQDGTVAISGGGALKAVTAKQISLDGGATLSYDSGLISTNFSSGPGGSWEIVPGSYVIVQ